MSPQPLNVLLLHTDQQRYDSLGCNGNPHAETPNLDRLARDGTVFHRHIAANTICMPSRASLLTGRYPNGHGVWHNGVPLTRREYLRLNSQCDEISLRLYGRNLVEDPPTLADILSAAGYRTAAVGKLHLTPYRACPEYGFPESHSVWQDPSMADWHGPYYGFDRVEITIGHGEGTGGHYRHWLQTHFPEVVAKLSEGKHRRSLEFPEVGDLYPSVLPIAAHHSTWCAERAIAFLDEAATSSRPFFLWVGFPDPHHPFTPSAELAERFATRQVLPPQADERELEEKPLGLREPMRQAESSLCARHLSPECLTRIRQYTDAMVHLIDQSVGRIIDTLKAHGLYDNTVILFTSDHGDFLGDHFLLRKETFCSSSLCHVPFIMRAPGVDLPSEVGTPMSNADVVPTLCELLNLSIPDGVQGRSVLTSDPDRRASVVCYSSDPRLHNFSVFDERYRFTWYPATGERELYDHQNDPYELDNLAGKPQVRDVEQRLYEALLADQCRYDSPCGNRIALW